MRIEGGYGWFLLMVTLGLAMGGSRRLTAQEVVLPESVKDALARYTELKTFSVTWTQQFEPGEEARAKLDAPTLKSWSRFEACYLVWQDGKVFKRRKERPPERKDGPDSGVYEFAFDGQILAGGRPHLLTSSGGKTARPVLRKDLAANSEADGDSFGVAYFEAFGVHFPGKVKELLKSKQLVSQVMFLLEHGGRLKAVESAEIDGRPMTRVTIVNENPAWPGSQRADPAKIEQELRALKTGKQTEEDIKQQVEAVRRVKERTARNLNRVFYLDPEFGYAVRRWEERTEDGRLRIQTNCTEHEKLPEHGIWLPRNCCRECYTFDADDPGGFFKTPYLTHVMKVSEFSTKPVPDEQFTLNYTKPGTKVADATFPESKQGEDSVNYIIPADAKDLDRVIEEARTLARVKANRANQGNWFKIVLIGGNIAALATLVVYLVVRHQRKVAKP